MATHVADAMIRRPKIHPPSLTVGESQAVFTDEHVHMLLLVENGRLLGTIVRDDLPAGVPPSAPALAHASLEGRTVAPQESIDQVRTEMLAMGIRRLAVIADDGELLGLLCLKRHLGGFCSEHDVSARAQVRS